MSELGLPPGTVGERPAEPAPELLTRATEGLTRRIGHEPGPWAIEERRERPRSTLFLLRARHANGVTHAVAKVDYLSARPEKLAADKLQRRVHERQEQLRRESRLAPALTRAVAEHGLAVTIDEPLAVLPERLSGLRVMVPGRELERAVTGLRRHGPRQLLALLRELGRFVRVMEEVGSGTGLAHSDVLSPQRRRLDRALERLNRAGPCDDLDRLRERSQALLEREVTERRAVVSTHGDLSQSNVLTGERGLGIIDFGWSHRLKGHDLAHFLVRIESERPRVPGFASAARRALLEGYGPREPTDRSVELAYLDRASSTLRRLTGLRGRLAQQRLATVCHHLMEDRSFTA